MKKTAAIILAACALAAPAAEVVKKYVSATNKVDGLPAVHLGRIQMADGSASKSFYMLRDPEFIPGFYDEVQRKTYNVVFANGRPIVVEKTPNVEGYNRVSWYRYLPSSNRPYIDVPDTDLVIVGGGNGRGTEPQNFANTAITLNGGKCRTIFGGNLGNGTIGSANIVVNEGSQVDVIYGGSAGMSFQSEAGLDRYGGVNSTFLTNQFSRASRCFVGSVRISINMLPSDVPIVAVFGGGFSVSDVGSADIRMTGGTIALRSGGSFWHVTNQRAMMCPGSSSGIVGAASFTMYGGYCDMVQAWSRGYTGGAEIIIKGGSVNRLFAGGDTTESANEGSVSTATGGWTTLELLGGTVTNLVSGYNNRIVNTEKVGGFYAYDVVINGDPESFNLRPSGSLDKAVLLGSPDEEFTGLGFIQRRPMTDSEYAFYTNHIPTAVRQTGVVDTDSILLLRGGFDKIATTNTTLQAVLNSLDERITALENAGGTE